MGAVTMGVDVGQRRDPTAIAVVDAAFRAGRVPLEMHHMVRHLERVPIGTSYPVVAERVAAVSAGVTRLARTRPTLYLDATGVGTPLLDVMRAANVSAKVVGVYFTHGDRRSVVDGEIRLGKAYLVGRLQALLQSGRLHLPHTAEAKALAAELLDYEIRVDENANDRYGAFKVGRHDDLVTALGLATQVDPRPFTYAVGGERPQWAMGTVALNQTPGSGWPQRDTRLFPSPDDIGRYRPR